MIFRKSTINDMPYIMNIFKQAQSYFKENGIDQWQNNYPNEDVIRNDIKNNDSYVMVSDDKVIATIFASFDKDITYNKIYNGKWLNDNDYCVIHRIAVDNYYKGQGVFYKLIKNIEELCNRKGIHTIKVDTHEDNITMQNTLNKNGFTYCGVIYLEDGDKRIAFQKNI